MGGVHFMSPTRRVQQTFSIVIGSFVRRSAGVFSPHRRAKTNYPTTVGFGSAPGKFEETAVFSDRGDDEDSGRS